MLPGKTYTPEDFLKIAWRRKWTIAVPFLLAAAGTAVVSSVLPDRYRSETTILVVPQRVPESYVRSTVTARIEDRLQSISPQILSRTKLELIIEEFDLYAEERRTELMEDVVSEMRADIDVAVVRGDAFRVSYVGGNPRTVMRVTDRLASLFIDENLRDRELLAEGTNQFLESQLDEARRRLIEQEQKLANYQRQHAGQLPTQAQANLQVYQNIQMQIQGLIDSVNRDRDRKVALERAMADLSLPDAQPAVMGSNPGAESQIAPPGSTLTEQVLNAEQSLRNLTEVRGLKAEHPDVVRLTRMVADLKHRAEIAALEAPLAPKSPAPAPSPLQMARRNRMRELQTEFEDLDVRIAAKQAEEQRLRQVAADYQARVEIVPMREAEMAELTRDYGTHQNLYNSLLAKKEDSRMAADLERREGGQQFKLLDPARLSEKPFSPNRTRINLLGAVFGLGLGAGLAALSEYRDTTLRTDDDVTAVLALPVLARIPVMTSADERRRLRWTRLVLSVTAAAMVVLVGTGLVAWKLGALNGFLK